MWRDELPGALHQNHVFAVRPDPARLNPEYLALLTRTLHARAYFERTGSKTTGLASTSSEKIGNLPVPSLNLEAQAEIVAEATRQVALMRAFRDRLSRQLDLLLERRQALITAAVTGQLEIPGVAA
jgi:type I restriction enzyme S subunit